VGLVVGPVTTSSKAFRAQLTTDMGDGGLAPGQSASIYVSYQPSGEVAGDVGTLQINSNAGQGQPVSILLSGPGH
jgi:hypothetical protein